MDLKKFKFPKVTGADLAFPTFGADPQLLREAKERGFYGGSTPFNHLFSTLFFQGGNLNFKPDLDPDFKASALPYLKALMGSFEPKHEEKEAICALLLSELCDHACNCADTRKDERTGPPRFTGETDTEIMPDGSIYRARHSFRVF